MDEITLINGCVKGDAKAQRMLFDRFAPKMLAVCMRYTSDQMEAEDILQEGFIKIFNKLSDFKMDGSLEGWIRRIMVNTSIDNIRKNKRIKEEANIDDVGYKISDEMLPSDDIMAEDLMKLIMEMPEGYKVVFNLFAIEGYSHKEIADTLNISENTSKSQYSRARAYLRTQLEQLKIER